MPKSKQETSGILPTKSNKFKCKITKEDIHQQEVL